MFSKAIPLIVLIAVNSALAGNCPPAWKDFNGKCILVSRIPRTYDQAAEFCAGMGGKLYEPTDRVREGVVRAFASSQPTLSGNTRSSYGPWIGINDLRSEGRFVFQSSGNPIAFAKWATPQPDNAGNNEDCVHFYRSGLWNDAPCTHLLGAVCERPQVEKNCVNILTGYN